METLSLILVILILIIIVYIFIKISLNVRKYGGSLTTTTFASTYEFLNKDKREAVEEIVEMNANKKMKEESSGRDYI